MVVTVLVRTGLGLGLGLGPKAFSALCVPCPLLTPTGSSMTGSPQRACPSHSGTTPSRIINIYPYATEFPKFNLSHNQIVLYWFTTCLIVCVLVTSFPRCYWPFGNTTTLGESPGRWPADSTTTHVKAPAPANTALQEGHDHLGQVLWSEDRGAVQYNSSSPTSWEVKEQLGPLKQEPQNHSLNSSSPSGGGSDSTQGTLTAHVGHRPPHSHFWFHNWQGLNAAKQQLSWEKLLIRWLSKTERIRKWPTGNRRVQQPWPPRRGSEPQQVMQGGEERERTRQGGDRTSGAEHTTHRWRTTGRHCQNVQCVLTSHPSN